MPIYAYECSCCNEVFEAEQRIVEEPLTDCPRCDSEASLKRLVQPISVVFKGSGFHVNDYAPKTGSNEAAPDCSGTPDSCPKCEPERPAD